MSFLIRLGFSALTLLIITRVVPGVEVESVFSAFVAAIVLGIVNTLVRPLFVLLTLPVTFLTAGLFLLVINGILFYGVASIIDGFEVSGFGAAMIGSLLMTLVTGILHRLIK